MDTESALAKKKISIELIKKDFGLNDQEAELVYQTLSKNPTPKTNQPDQQQSSG